jgi:hypothetical protein
MVYQKYMVMKHDNNKFTKLQGLKWLQMTYQEDAIVSDLSREKLSILKESFRTILSITLDLGETEIVLRVHLSAVLSQLRRAGAPDRGYFVSLRVKGMKAFALQL